jgi:hypothetical protein
MDQSFGNLGAGAGGGSSSGGSNSKAAVSSSSFLQLPLSTASPAYYGAPLALLHHHAAAVAAGGPGPSSSQQQQSPYATKHASTAEMSSAEAEAIKAKIVAHPQYSALLAAYLDCQKVLSLSSRTLAAAITGRRKNRIFFFIS